jgi:hypothetical protein
MEYFIATGYIVIALLVSAEAAALVVVVRDVLHISTVDAVVRRRAIADAYTLSAARDGG